MKILLIVSLLLCGCINANKGIEAINKNYKHAKRVDVDVEITWFGACNITYHMIDYDTTNALNP